MQCLNKYRIPVKGATFNRFSTRHSCNNWNRTLSRIPPPNSTMRRASSLKSRATRKADPSQLTSSDSLRNCHGDPNPISSPFTLPLTVDSLLIVIIIVIVVAMVVVTVIVIVVIIRLWAHGRTCRLHSAFVIH